MDWEQLVAEFRELGGVADNVRLGFGRFGRGVFAIDPSQPVKLHAPPNLLVPIDALEIRNGALVAKTSAPVGERERAFFDRYQEHFGWGAGGLAEVWHEQEEWHRLPPEVCDFIKRMGVSEHAGRNFVEAGVDACFFTYVHRRDFAFAGKAHLAPLVDLANHSNAAPVFVIADGVGVAGTFEDEVFARYNARDALANVLSYGFSDGGGFAYSLGLTANVDGRKAIVIGRDTTDGSIHANIWFPRASIDGDTIRLPFLTLGSSAAPDLPRAIFRRVAAPALGLADADKTFDSIAQFNHHKVLALLQLLRQYDGPLLRKLEASAIHQLGTLSDCVGARDLTAVGV